MYIFYRAVERGVEPVIFAGARDSKEAQKSEIGLFWAIFWCFWDLKSVKFLQIWGPALKSIYEFGAGEDKKFS
jgi:hypothetical protein